jgi:hypothetical protein
MRNENPPFIMDSFAAKRKNTVFFKKCFTAVPFLKL